MVFLGSVALSLFLSGTALADNSQLNQPLHGHQQQLATAEPASILLAQNQKQPQQVRGGSRQRHLTGEARSSSAKTNIDFDAAAIDGERRAPVGVAIGSNKSDHEYDLINLRLRWHPEMIKSTSNLETGRGQ